jgi:hypothetical protein
MTQPIARADVAKIHKLVQLAAELPKTQWGCQITRLTSLKSLCQEPAVANRFVAYLARKTWQRVHNGHGRSTTLKAAKAQAHRQLMHEALSAMEAWMQAPTEARHRQLRDLLAQVRDEQNEHRRIKWGSVRIIHDSDLLLVEYALHCLLGPADQSGHWAYQTARHYAERYNAHFGTGLIPESAPFVQDIADFWTELYGIEPSLPSATGKRKTAAQPQPANPSADKPTRRKGSASSPAGDKTFTQRQGQFLAFIHCYRQLHRRGPAETDMVKFFRVTPPAVHGMVVQLEKLGLVTREPGVARSVRVAIPEEKIPKLADVQGPPWQ